MKRCKPQCRDGRRKRLPNESEKILFFRLTLFLFTITYASEPAGMALEYGMTLVRNMFAHIKPWTTDKAMRFFGVLRVFPPGPDRMPI